MQKKYFLLLFTFSFYSFANAQIIDTFPWLENFDQLVSASGQQIPADWSAENLDADFSIWDVLSDSESFPDNSHSEPNGMHMSFSFNAMVNDWLYTPPMMLEANTTYILSFWYRSVSFGGETSEKMKIHVGNLPTSEEMSSFPIWDNPLIMNQTYVKDSVSFTPDNDGIFHFAFNSYSDAEQFLLLIDDISVSIENNTSSTPELSVKKDIVYPNPSNGNVYISTQKPNVASLRIFDLSGQLLADLPIRGGLSKLDLNNFPKGFYTYCIRYANNEESMGKLILN